jgi:hypothetical protein
VLGVYEALHLISGSGQGAHVAAGQAGHALGSGHFTTGQRGRGQGGHSPILHGLEHVLMHGGHLGTDDLRTYLDISGCGGHSVFNMYLDISGIGGQGGTVAFNTHLLGSGSGQAGHPADPPALLLPFGPHLHGLTLQLSQRLYTWKFSTFPFRAPSRYPIINAKSTPTKT